MKNDDTKKRLAVTLPEKTISEIEVLAKENGLTKSGVVAIAISFYARAPEMNRLLGALKVGNEDLRKAVMTMKENLDTK